MKIITLRFEIRDSHTTFTQHRIDSKVLGRFFPVTLVLMENLLKNKVKFYFIAVSDAEYQYFEKSHIIVYEILVDTWTKNIS